jgi:hypothetical protein
MSRRDLSVTLTRIRCSWPVHSVEMKPTLLTAALVLTGLLSACGTAQPPAMGTPPDDTAPRVTYTSLEAVVDLSRGINTVHAWTSMHESFYLMKVGASEVERTQMAETQLDDGGRARVTLPPAAAVDRFLDPVTLLSSAADLPATCKEVQFEAQPNFFRAVVAQPVLAYPVGPLTRTGYITLLPRTPDGSAVTFLEYIDKNVRISTEYVCTGDGYQERTVTALNLVKGWNVITATATTRQTASGLLDTLSYTNEPATTTTVALALMAGPQADVPVP